MRIGRIIGGVLVAAFLAGLTAGLLWIGCGEKEVKTGRTVASPEILDKHCREMVGPPRVEQVSEHVWVAIGYDLANTVLIHTPAGNVIVDAGMSPVRAKRIRRALAEKAPAGPIAALIYTHSHVDHVGGATAWADPGVPIWATAALPDHLLKQYQTFLPAESMRGRRQFGHQIDRSSLPCSALGRCIDLTAAKNSGILPPTHTFTGRKKLVFGGMEIVLIEAHGETHDQLVVWVPADRTLVAGDNFYWAFPNLYTIRGTSPRPVDAWIKSLDMMRRLRAEHLVPNHTIPVHGQARVNEVLTNYRDIIQWVRDAVVRGANAGRSVDDLAESIKLPVHLAKHHYAKELYGQIDWSVRAIYSNNLGWFDGRADLLYPMPAAKAAAKEVALMGGEGRVLKLAGKAASRGDHRWAIHLLAKLRTSGLAKGSRALDLLLAKAYEDLAEGVANTNGRGYLLRRARELRQGLDPLVPVKLPQRMVDGIPLDHIFSILVARLIPERAMDVHESLVFELPDKASRYVLTVRRGICELAKGEPLPGTPAPVGVITMQPGDFRKMALKIEGPLSLYTRGKISLDGGWIDTLAFLRRFGTD